MSGFNAAEADRRISNVVQMGRITAVDTANARCRVAIGDLVTPPIPWPAGHAGADRSWWAPSVGDQVMIAAPSGDLAQAAVISTYYQDSAPAPSSDGAVSQTVYADGAVVEYDNGKSQFQLRIGTTSITANGSAITLSCNGSTLVLDAGGAELNGQFVELG